MGAGQAQARHRRRSVWGLASVLAAAAVSWAGEGSLVSNGTFERGLEGWQLETGSGGDDLGGPNRVSFPAGVARSGERCARFDFTGRHWLWLDLDVGLSARLPLKPGNTLKLAFWARRLSGEGRVSAGFNMRGKADGAWLVGRDHLALATIPKGRRWHRIEMSLAAPFFDAKTACLQLKLGAHSNIGIKAESFLIDDLSLRIAPPAHRVRLRFEDATPTDGWGTNLRRVALFVNGAPKPTLAFRCDTDAERACLAEDKGSFTWKGDKGVRVADGRNSFTYEFPVAAPDVRKLTVETEMWGTFLMRIALDDYPFAIATRCRQPVHGAGNAGLRRVELLPMAGRRVVLIGRAAPEEGAVTASLVTTEPLPAGCSLEWLVGRRGIGRAPIGTGEVRLDHSMLPRDLRWTLPVGGRIRGPHGKRIAWTQASISIPNLALFQKRLSHLGRRRQELAPLLEQAAAKGVGADDADIVLAALKVYPDYIREDLTGGKLERAACALDFLVPEADRAVGALKRSLRRGAKGTRPPMPSVLKLAVRDGGFYQGQKPVFLIGPMRDRIRLEELATIADLGFNAVELVVAPSWDSPKDYQYYGDFLALAAKRNIAVYVLLSAHYFPKWWGEKHPEILRCGEFCTPWCISSPRLRELIGAWYEKIIPFLRGKPAVLSYCLANEPHYNDTGYCPLCRAAFQRWLRGRYGTIEALNRRWGTKLASLEQVEVVKGRKSTPAHYDWFRFDDHRMGEFFRWERQAVRRLDPHTPTHNEPMAWTALSTASDGIDFEDQAALSDINGCDGGTRWRASGTYAVDWLNGQSLPYDLMKSIAPSKPIFNSEWHITTQDTPAIPPEYLRATAWLATLHGQAGATIWVWTRAYPRQQCPFLARPGAVVAAGKVTRELNRFADEIALFQRPPRKRYREVCLLYSSSSLAHLSLGACRRAYESLYFLDVPLGFVTERQAGRGALDGVRLLVVPEAECVTDACAAGIERFVRDGGTLAVVGNSLMRNEYGDPRRDAGLLVKEGAVGKGRVVRIPSDSAPAECAPLFDKLMDECSVARPVRSDAWGVVCRTAADPARGRLVCVLINLTRETKRVRLTVRPRHGRMRDLVADRRVLWHRVKLPSLGAALLEVPLRTGR